VSTLELADLAELDFGSWRTPRGEPDVEPPLPATWEAPDRDRTEVLTLQRLLDTLCAADRPVQLAIETKHPTRYAGLVEQTLVELLGHYGLCSREGNGAVRTRVMSFATTGLRRVRLLAPDLPTVQLMHRIMPLQRDGSISSIADSAGPSLEGLRRFPSFVERAHDRGHQVHVWTVDEPADVDFVMSLGVDVIITNRPADVLAQLGGTARSAI
jgi:glycerophosphoryl diester phosphodiesterase